MVDCFRFYAESHNEDEPLSRRSSQRTAVMFIRDALDTRNGTTLDFITDERRALLSQNGDEDFVLAAVLLELLRWLEDEKVMRYGLPRYSGRTLTMQFVHRRFRTKMLTMRVVSLPFVLKRCETR